MYRKKRKRNYKVARISNYYYSCCLFLNFFQVHVIPDNIDLQQAVLLEPLSCLAHGWKRLNGVNVGSNVLVIGAGIIGLLWACMLHLHGLRKSVTVSEPQEKRRKMLNKLGNSDIIS